MFGGLGPFLGETTVSPSFQGLGDKTGMTLPNSLWRTSSLWASSQAYRSGVIFRSVGALPHKRPHWKAFTQQGGRLGHSCLDGASPRLPWSSGKLPLPPQPSLRPPAAKAVR